MTGYLKTLGQGKLYKWSPHLHSQEEEKKSNSKANKEKRSRHNLKLSSTLSASQVTSNSLPEEGNKIILGRDQASTILIQESQVINSL